MSKASPAPAADLVGPYSLQEALDAGEGKVRVAVSSPHGDLIAIRAGETLLIRRVARISGQSGSVLGTGCWVAPASVPPSISWRPA